jgi:hypothetical protein
MGRVTLGESSPMMDSISPTRKNPQEPVFMRVFFDFPD